MQSKGKRLSFMTFFSSNRRIQLLYKMIITISGESIDSLETSRIKKIFWDSNHLGTSHQIKWINILIKEKENR